MKFKIRIEDIKYIKIFYKNLSSTLCNSKIGIKSMNDKEIIACGKFENGLKIETPQEIDLNIICNDGIYKTKTKLISFENEEPYTFFKIQTPQNIDYEQNREYFRIQTNFDCIYKILETNKEYKTKTVDLSANGVSIILPCEEISSEKSEIQLFINNKTIDLEVQNIRNEKLDNGYKLSLTFINISEADRDFISQVCIKKQLEDKKYHLK